MPVNWTFKGESGKSFTNTAVTLASQGVTSASIQFRSLEADVLVLEYKIDDYASSATLPELRQKISLYRDSTRFFHGHVIRVSPRQTVQDISVKVEVAGPWWWLERIPMTSSRTDGAGNSEDRPIFVFGSFSSPADMATNIGNAIDRAIALGAPMIKGSIASSFTVPQITLSQQTCGGVLAELVRLIPDTMVYFDYADTGTDADATIKVERRGAATTRTLNVSSSALVSLQIDPLIELEVSQVKIPFVTRAATGETQFTTQDHGSASTGKVEILPVSGPELVDFLPNDQLDTLEIAASFDGDETGLKAAVKAIVYPGWADLTADYGSTEGSQWGLDVSSTFINGATSGITVNRNLTAANTGNSAGAGGTTQTFAAGSHAYPQQSFTNFNGKKFVQFVGDQDPPQWAIDDFQMVQFTPLVISWFDGNDTGSNFNQDRRLDLLNIVQWTYSRGSTNSTGIEIPGAPTFLFGIWTPTNDEVKLWMMNASDIPSSNKLIRKADFQFASPPNNFAQNLLNCQNYVPHEGTITISSADVGATRFRGTKVNVTGSLSSLSSMGAMVSGETLNIKEGITQISLGQPPRLDFLEFASRVRRTPQDNTEYL